LRLPVHLWVVNDLAEYKDALVLENLPRRICQVDRPLDAVAKAKLFREHHGHPVHLHGPASSSNLLHDLAAVMRLHLGLYRRHDIRRAQIHPFLWNSSRFVGHVADG